MKLFATFKQKRPKVLIDVDVRPQPATAGHEFASVEFARGVLDFHFGVSICPLMTDAAGVRRWQIGYECAKKRKILDQRVGDSSWHPNLSSVHPLYQAELFLQRQGKGAA